MFTRQDLLNEKKNQNTSLLGDTVDAFQAGAARSMGGMASFVGLDSAAEKMNEIANSQYRTMTPESQIAMGKRLINDDLSLGEGFTDGRTWLLNVAQIVGDMAPTILPGGAVGKGISLAGRVAKAGEGVAKVAGAANMGTLVATNLSSAGGQAGLAARDDIMNLSYEDLADSPIFQELAVSYHKKGMSQEDALSKAQQDIADEVKNRITYDPTMMVINGTLGALGDKAMTKVVSGKLGRTIKGAIGKAIVAEGGTEAAQGAAQRYTQNVESNKAAGGEIYDPTQGVAQEAIEGGILGAVVGGGGGAVGGAVGNVRRRSFEKNVEGIITPQAITDAKASGLTDGEIRKSFENSITNAALERGFEVDEAETMAKNAVMSAFGEGPTAEQRASMEDAQEQSSQPEDRQRPEGAELRDQMIAEQRASREEPKLEVGEPNPRDFGLKAEDAELLIDPPAELFDSNGNFAKPEKDWTQEQRDKLKELKQQYQVAQNRRGAEEYVQAVTDYRYNNSKPYQESLELAQVPEQANEPQQAQPQEVEPTLSQEDIYGQLGLPSDYQPTEAAQRVRQETGTDLQQELANQEQISKPAPNIRREREMIAPTEAAQRVRSQLPEFEAEAQRRQQAEESQLIAEQEAEAQRERDLNRGFEAQQSFNKEGQKAINQAKQSQVEPTRQIEQTTVYQPRQQTREQVRYEEPAPTAEEIIERNRGKRSGVLKGNLGESMPAKRNKRQVKKAKSKLKAAQQTIYDRITKADPLATNEVEQDFAATTGYTPNSAMMEAFESLKPTKKEPTPEEVEQRVGELEDSGTVEKADADAIRLQARRDYINEYELPDDAPVWMQQDQDNIDKLKDAQVNKLYEAIKNNPSESEQTHNTEATDEQRKKLTEIANDFFRGLDNVNKTVARKARDGIDINYEEANKAISQHEKYVSERDLRAKESETQELEQSERVYGKLSKNELLQKLSNLGATGYVPDEISDGRRSTLKAVTNEAARGKAEESMKLERYIKHKYGDLVREGSKGDINQVEHKGISLDLPVVSKETESDYNRGSHLGRGRDFNQEILDESKNILDTLDSKGLLDTPERKAKAKELIEKYQQDMVDFYKWEANHAAKNPSWHVTGRSNRNMSKYNAAQERHMNEFTKRVDKLTNQRKNIPDRVEAVMTAEQKEAKAAKGKETMLKNQEGEVINYLVRDIFNYMMDGKAETAKDNRKWALRKAKKALETIANQDSRDRARKLVDSIDKKARDESKDKWGIMAIVGGKRSALGKYIDDLMTHPVSETASKAAEANTRANESDTVKQFRKAWSDISYSERQMVLRDVKSIHPASREKFVRESGETLNANLINDELIEATLNNVKNGKFQYPSTKPKAKPKPVTIWARTKNGKPDFVFQPKGRQAPTAEGFENLGTVGSRAEADLVVKNADIAKAKQNISDLQALGGELAPKNIGAGKVALEQFKKRNKLDSDAELTPEQQKDFELFSTKWEAHKKSKMTMPIEFDDAVFWTDDGKKIETGRLGTLLVPDEHPVFVEAGGVKRQMKLGELRELERQGKNTPPTDVPVYVRETKEAFITKWDSMTVQQRKEALENMSPTGDKDIDKERKTDAWISRIAGHKSKSLSVSNTNDPMIKAVLDYKAARINIKGDSHTQKVLDKLLDSAKTTADFDKFFEDNYASLHAGLINEDQYNKNDNSRILRMKSVGLAGLGTVPKQESANIIDDLQAMSDKYESNPTTRVKNYELEPAWKKVSKAMEEAGATTHDLYEFGQLITKTFKADRERAIKLARKILEGEKPEPTPPKGTKKTGYTRTQTAPRGNEKSKPKTLKDYKAQIEDVSEGKASRDDMLALAKNFRDDHDAMIAELNSMTMPKIKEMMGQYWSMMHKDYNKANLVEAAWGDLMKNFLFAITADHFISTSGQRGKELGDYVIGKLEAVSVEDYNAVQAKKAEKAKAEATEAKRRKEALDNPITLQDFVAYARDKGEGIESFSPEQLKRYDELMTEQQVLKLKERQQKAAEIRAVDGEVSYQLAETVHTKLNEPRYVVQLTGERLGKEAFKDLAARARQLGGNFVNAMQAKRYNTIDGFQFANVEDRNTFAQLLDGEQVSSERRQAEKLESKQDSRVTKLKEMADKLEADANEEINRPRKTNTAKRSREAASAMDSAYSNQHDARLMRGIAEATEAGKVELLGNLSQKVQLDELLRARGTITWNLPEDKREQFAYRNEQGNWKLKPETKLDDILYWVKYPAPEARVETLHRIADAMEGVKGFKQAANKIRSNTKTLNSNDNAVLKGRQWETATSKIREFARKNKDEYVAQWLNELFLREDRLNRMGINGPAALRNTLRELSNIEKTISSDRPVETPVTKLEREITETIQNNRNAYNDFFPTDNDALADHVVELADIQVGEKVLEPNAGMGHLADKIKAKGADLEVGELAYKMQNLLEEKGHKVVSGDFLEYNPGPIYDKIVMNPPFSNDADVKHVTHAISMLKPGGRLVAITGAMAGDKSNSANKNFREYLDSVDAVEEANPEGSFKHSINPTGVNTKTIVIDKPEDPTNLPVPDDIRFSQSSLVDKAKGFKERLNKLLLSKNAHYSILISSTPVALQKLGVKVKDIYVTKRVVDKATNDKHTVPISVFEQLPELLSDPVAVFTPKDDSHARKGSKNIIIEAKDNDGKPILVAIHADSNLGSIKDVNVVKSVFGKKPESLNYWIEDGKLEYIKSKAPEWLDRPGLPLPETPSGSRIRENTQEPKLSTRQLGHDSHQLAYNPRKLLISSTASDNLIVGDRDLKSNDKTRPARLGVSLVENEAQKWLDGYQGLKAANIQVVEKQSDLSQWVETDPEATVKGVWLSGDNRVVLVAENLSSMADVRKTLRHELIAHNGLYGNLSSAERDALTNKVMKLRGNAKLKSIFTEVDNSYKNAPDDVKAEEVIARIAESESGKLRQIVDRVMAMIMGALRRSGVLSQEKVTISEVRNMINGVDRYLRRNDGTLSLPNAVRFSQRVDKVEGLDKSYDAILEGTQQSFMQKVLSKTLDKSKVRDALKSGGWNFLTLRQTADVAAKKVSKQFASHIDNYMGEMNQMTADEGRATQDILSTFEGLDKWRRKNKAESDRVFNFMHDLTLENVDPTQEYADMTPELEKAKASLQAQIRSRSGEANAKKVQEITEIDQQIKNEPRREKIHERRRKEFLALPKESQEVIKKIADHYTKQREDVTNALMEKATDLAMDGGKIGKAMMLKIRLDNEIAKKGFYVPLARFGDYFIDGINENGERVFTMYQTQAEMDRAFDRLHAAGYEVKKGKTTEQRAGLDSVSASFVTKMTQELETTTMSEKARDELKDRVYQLYLDTLPTRSIRKQFIHRKGVAGFSKDALQALADQGAKQAKQLSRLKHEDKMQQQLDALNKEYEDLKTRPEGSEDRVSAARIMDSMSKRHEWVMNPQRAAWASKMTGFGFFWLIGASPASALINVTQNVQVALPVIGAKYGVAKTGQVMAGLTGDFIKNFKAAHADMDTRRKHGILGSTILKGDELKAMEEAIAMGVIDTTQTHDLIGLAENQTSEITDTTAKVMRGIGWMFHHAEVLNREVTFMTAYRMAKNAGESHAAAKDYAVKATWDSHFDYGSLNRAKFMQGDVASVALQFKQYSQNMTFYLVHNFLQAFALKNPVTGTFFSTVSKNTTAEERAMARKQLMGTMAATFLIGGLGAMPVATLAAIANMAHDIVGDDDEPWDAETELKGIMAEWFGEELADGMYYGLGTMVGLPNISSRIEIDPKSMWFRDSYSMDSQGAFKEQALNALGPTFSILTGAAKGFDYIFREQKYQQGFEAIAPKWVRDVSKTARYLGEGGEITNRQGDVVVADLSPLEYAEQLLGFTPSRQLVQGAKNRAYKDYERQIMDRRKLLMNSMWQTYRTNDVEGMKNVWKRIDKFNRSDWGRLNPITQKTVNQSMRIRARGQSKAKNGIRINDKYISQLNAMYAAN